METQPMLGLYNTKNVSSPTEFNQALQSLVEGLKNEAAAGSSIRKYATQNISGPDFLTIYGLTQCTPDLAQSQCNDCLEAAIEWIPGCCNDKQGGRIVTPSCNLRYEINRFYNAAAPLPSPPPPPPSPPPLSSSPPKDKKSNTTLIVIIVVAASSAVIVVVGISVLFFRRSKKPRKFLQNEDELESFQIDSLRFDLVTIKDATSNFSTENKLGQGGFGTVYKGTLRNGTEVAVKRLSKGSLQGELEFKNEVLLVAKLQHKNLVRLLGFCLDREERLLIYEFVVNSSLDHFIFDLEKRKLLDWTRRYKIIVGIARGLLYLHEDSRLRIIHRDLKASNILLDAEMNPKISDFGLAKLFAIDQSEGNTSKIAGTYGYMAPEYAAYGQFSVKSDVFSFGVLLLEILSGRKNLNFQKGENVEDLLSYTWKNWSKGTPMNVVDPTLSTGSDIEKMRCIHIGLLCVQENVCDRPDMASIALMLSSSSLSLARPAQPAFFLSTITGSLEPRPFTPDHDSRVSSASKLNEEAVPLSRNEASITELSPR